MKRTVKVGEFRDDTGAVSFLCTTDVLHKNLIGANHTKGFQITELIDSENGNGGFLLLLSIQLPTYPDSACPVSRVYQVTYSMPSLVVCFVFVSGEPLLAGDDNDEARPIVKRLKMTPPQALCDANPEGSTHMQIDCDAMVSHAIFPVPVFAIIV